MEAMNELQVSFSLHFLPSHSFSPLLVLLLVLPRSHPFISFIIDDNYHCLFFYHLPYLTNHHVTTTYHALLRNGISIFNLYPPQGNLYRSLFPRRARGPFPNSSDAIHTAQVTSQSYTLSHLPFLSTFLVGGLSHRVDHKVA